MKDPREMTESECCAEVCVLAKGSYPRGLDGASDAIYEAGHGWEWTRTPTYFRAENDAGEVHDVYCPKTNTPSEELWRVALLVWRSI